MTFEEYQKMADVPVSHLTYVELAQYLAKRLEIVFAERDARAMEILKTK